MNHLFMAWLLPNLTAAGPAALVGGLLTLAILAVLLGCLTANLLQYRRSPDAAFSIEDFSLDRYRPMARLLAEDELAFLSAQPGCNAKIVNQLKSDRRRIFRMYLRELAADFRMLHKEARQMAAFSPEQHSEVIGSLLRQQATFWMALTAIELRLMLPQLGEVDVAELLTSVEAVRLDLARMAA